MIPLIVQNLRHPYWFVRSEASSVLGKYAEKTPKKMQLVLKALQEAYPDMVKEHREIYNAQTRRDLQPFFELFHLNPK